MNGPMAGLMGQMPPRGEEPMMAGMGEEMMSGGGAEAVAPMLQQAIEMLSAGPMAPESQEQLVAVLSEALASLQG